MVVFVREPFWWGGSQLVMCCTREKTASMVPVCAKMYLGNTITGISFAQTGIRNSIGNLQPDVMRRDGSDGSDEMGGMGSTRHGTAAAAVRSGQPAFTNLTTSASHRTDR